MSTSIPFNLQVKKYMEMEGFVHVYLYDSKHTFLDANKVLIDFFFNIFNIPNQRILGNKISNILKDYNTGASSTIIEENNIVISSGMPKQFYNSVIIQNKLNIDFVTVKMPIYDESGNIYVLGISQYVNLISKQDASNYGISDREFDCLIQLLYGNTSKQIAKQLCLSPRTVEHYIDNLKAKLNCQSKAELILKSTQSIFKINAANICSNKNVSII